jgi:hypothetical protein
VEIARIASLLDDRLAIEELSNRPAVHERLG